MSLDPEWPPPPGMHAPDWDRYSVNNPSAMPPVGDPTRWGAEVRTRLEYDKNITSAQIIAANTRDAYARPWSIVGTLSLTPKMWAANENPTPVPYVAIVTLECVLGVGQVQLMHSILLSGPGRSGLCATQSAILGGGNLGNGPYAPYTESVPIKDGTEVRAFAAIGAVLGQSISIRARYIINVEGVSNPPLSDLPFNSRIQLMVTPYAVGQGL